MRAICFTRSIIKTLASTDARALMLLCAMFFYASCREISEFEGTGDEVITLETGFPYPVIPTDNQPTQNRIDLGEKIFFDPILSRDSTIACGSCHHTDKKFTDGLQFGEGIDGNHTLRNAMTILNVAYQPYIFWDGGVPTLEQQVLGPIGNPLEMDYDVNKVVARMRNHPEYPRLFQRAYHQEPSVYTLTRAIACYERTLFSGFSRYDDYLYNNNTSALNSSEINGKAIFFGEKGECFHCHNEYNFTDYSFKNNGLYLQYADSGRARITGLHSDVGKFKVPSLRNVEFTAPYMHDGSLATLEDVVEHYDSGGKPHPNKSGLIQPLHLTTQEKQDLVNFLKALSDQ
jgi:cytochrome c peroxidase